MTRLADDIKAEMKAIEDSGKKSPAKMGALRKEWGSALELERDAALKAPAAATSAPATDSRESEDRKWQMATAMMQAYFEKNRDNINYLQSLVNAFPAFMDAAEKMVACKGEQALAQKAKESDARCKEMIVDLDLAKSRIRDQDERIIDLSNRMVVNGVPI